MGMSIMGLFAVCSATVGFRAVLWGLGIFHLIGALGVLALWWWEERQGSKAASPPIRAGHAFSLGASATRSAIRW